MIRVHQGYVEHYDTFQVSCSADTFSFWVGAFFDVRHQMSWLDKCDEVWIRKIILKYTDHACG